MPSEKQRLVGVLNWVRCEAVLRPGSLQNAVFLDEVTSMALYCSMMPAEWGGGSEVAANKMPDNRKMAK